MNDFLIAALAFLFGFGACMSVFVIVAGRWVWRQFQEQRKKSASGDELPKRSSLN